jgi:tetratricopeptide (TPR) repeat protein
MALATLAGALAWSPPTFAFEADAEAESAPSGKFVYHTVERSETVWEIADRYGASVASVIHENEIEDPSKIWVGTRLRIPVPSDTDPAPGDTDPVGVDPAPVGTDPAPAGTDPIPVGADPAPVGADPALDAEEKAHAEDPEATRIAALLSRCEAELRAAHFEQALASAGEARNRIDARNGTADDLGRVRLEIVSATAYVALGQSDAALESLERALIANPGLELDPALTSPKVLAVFRVARGRAAPTR